MRAVDAINVLDVFFAVDAINVLNVFCTCYSVSVCKHVNNLSVHYSYTTPHPNC